MNSDTLFVLAPFVRVGFADGMLFFGFGSIQKKIESKKEQDVFLEAALFWKEPRSTKDVTAHLNSVFPNLQQTNTDTVSQFVNGKFLVSAGLYDRDERFSRQLLFYALCGGDPRKIQERLRSKHVAVLGSGGIGNMVSTTLATMGVAKLTLMDGDSIELSNLSRQLLFTEADTGKPKVATLKKAILERASKTVIETHYEPVTKEALEKITKPVDLLVLSADTVGLQQEVNNFCIKNRVPFISIGYIQDIAVFGPFIIPGQTGCYKCQPLSADNKELDEGRLDKVKQINKGYQAPSIGPLNMMAASHGLLDIIKYLGDFGTIHSLNKRIGIWSHNFKIEEQNSERNPNCPECSHLF